MIQLHPGAAEAYRRLAENLHQAIEGEEVRRELRKLIDRVDFIPVAGLGKFQLEVHDSLAALLILGQAQTAENPGRWPSELCKLGCGSWICAIPHTRDPPLNLRRKSC